MTCRARTCCCSSTTCSASRRPVPRCRRSSAVCLRPWDTSRTSPTRWVSCRSASRRPRATPSPRCRPCTCPPTTTPTRRRSRRSATSTPPRTSPVRSPPSASSRPWTRWRRRRRILTPDVVGDRHYNVARRVQSILQRYKELQDIIAILGIDELSEEDKVLVAAGPQGAEVPVAADVRGQGVHRSGGHLHARWPTPSRASRSCARASSTHVPEQAFLNVGGIDSVLEKAAKLERGEA